MLQKLLITCFIMFLISACGGSSNEAPAPQEPPPVNHINGDNDDDDDDTNVGDDSQSGGWLNLTFDDSSDADSWSHLCIGDCNSTVLVEYNSEVEALDVAPSWASADDQLEISTFIAPEIADLTGGYAHLNLYVPAAYTSAGSMIAQVFFQDASDRKAYIGYRTVAAGWNTFYFEDIQLGTGNNDPFGFFADGFDLTNINHMGVQLQGAEGFIDLEAAPLHIDDVIISPEPIEADSKTGDEEPAERIEGAPAAPPAGDISYRFESGIDGWHINGTGNTTTTATGNIALGHDAVNEALRITPVSWALNETENYRYESRIELTEATDLTDASARVIVYVPEAYATDGNLSFQLVTSGGDSYGDPVDGIQAGFNTIDFRLADRTEDITAVETVGLQIASGPADSDLLDPILLMSLDVYTDGNINELILAVDAGWQNDGSPATISYENGVVITPDWSADQQVAYILLEEPVDLVGATVTYVIDVPEAYITDGQMAIQPFSQQNSAPFAGIDDGAITGGWNPAGGLNAGENTIIHGPFSADQVPENLQRVGVRLNKSGMADGVDGDITIRSVTVTFPE